MLIGEIDDVEFAPEYPELVGKRVMVTGVRCPLGYEIVRGFSEARVLLAAQFSSDLPENRQLIGQIKTRSLDARVLFGAGKDHVAALSLVREAVQAFDGVDAVINIVSIDESMKLGDECDVEQQVSDLLALPSLATRVAANRMRTTHVAGSILNILTTPRGLSPRAAVLASIARSVLTGFTRSEATEWSQHGIRINAIAPIGPTGDARSRISSAPDVSTLAMHLACERGHQLSGLMFEAYAG